MQKLEDSGLGPPAQADAGHACPLCGESRQISPVPGADAREYFLCGNCCLVFVDSRFHPSQAEARKRYEQHNNSPDDAGYVAFLNSVLKPMLGLIRTGMRGLDYGCGPGPALSGLVRRAGIECSDFDPLFFPEPPQPPYDFIFSTETFEHFFNPRSEIEKLRNMLADDGYLGVMTELWDSIGRFKTWHYSRDFTHVSFYHSRTFEYIRAEFGFEKVFDDGRRVFVLKKI